MRTSTGTRPALFRHLLAGATLLLGTLMLAPVLAAQAPGRMGNPQEMQARRLELLTTRLTLTPQQIEQVKPILAKQSEESQALFQRAGGAQGDRAAMRTEMMSIRERTDKQIAAVLTDAQKTQFKALLEEEQRARAQRMGGGGR